MWWRWPANSEASLSQIAKDFGILESCLYRWLELADIDDGVRPGVIGWQRQCESDRDLTLSSY
jgi:transposase-like protein